MAVHDAVLSPPDLLQLARFYCRHAFESRHPEALDGELTLFNEPRFVEGCLILERLLKGEYELGNFEGFVGALTGVGLLIGDSTIFGDLGPDVGVPFIEMVLSELGFVLRDSREDQIEAFRYALRHNLQHQDGGASKKLITAFFCPPNEEIHQLLKAR